MDTVHPIYLVGGSKGGVGKSMVTLALADHLQRQGIHAVLLETDTRCHESAQGRNQMRGL